ncbi:MAG: MlaD family protein [Planctomycetota bacterium]
MDENRLRFGVGVLVIAAIGVGVILTFLFGAFPSILNDSYTVTVLFDSAAGVTENTIVTRDGVRIGRVTDVRLRNDDNGGVLLTLEIDDTDALTRQYIPTVGAGSLVTGESSLKFVRANDKQLLSIFDGQALDGETAPPPNRQLDPAEMRLINQPIRDDNFLPYGRVEGGPLDVLDVVLRMEGEMQDTMASFRRAGESVEKASNTVSKLAGTLNSTMNDGSGKVGAFADKANTAITEFTDTMRDIRTLLNDEDIRTALQKTYQNVDGVISEADNSLKAAQNALRAFESVGDETRKTVVAARKTVENVNKFTEPFADRGEDFSEQLLTTLGSLDRALNQIDQFGRTLNQGDGTIRRLITDDDLYYEIRRVVRNIEDATQRVRPILDDARVLSDKLARDPRLLGVKGGLSRRPLNTGVKN